MSAEQGRELDLSFISDDGLLAMIERDLDEVEKCLGCGACKAATVLAGSITEAVLMDHYRGQPPAGKTENSVLRADLIQLVEWARSDGLISEAERSIANAVRVYRDVIHPGRVLRESRVVDDGMARVARELMVMIVRALGQWHAGRRGPTPTTMMWRAYGEVGFFAIREDLVRAMVPKDRTRLFRAIPGKAAELGTRSARGALRLRELLRNVRQYVTDEVAREVVKDAYLRMRNDGRELQSFIELSFMVSDLGTLEASEAETVVAFLIATTDSWYDRADEDGTWQYLCESGGYDVVVCDLAEVRASAVLSSAVRASNWQLAKSLLDSLPDSMAEEMEREVRKADADGSVDQRRIAVLMRYLTKRFQCQEDDV